MNFMRPREWRMWRRCEKEKAAGQRGAVEEQNEAVLRHRSPLITTPPTTSILLLRQVHKHPHILIHVPGQTESILRNYSEHVNASLMSAVTPEGSVWLFS